MRRRTVVTLCLTLLGTVGLASADDVAQPWGTIHSDLSGTTSSTAVPLTFDNDWYNGVELAWKLDTRALGLNRVAGRNSAAFDEDGNLYWHTSRVDVGGVNESFLASVAPDGTLRWVASSGGDDVLFGDFDATTPVIGDGDRVYQRGDDFVGAYLKSTGVEVWSTPLPDLNFAIGAGLTPALYDGLLYVVGAPDGNGDLHVYVLDSTDGTLILDATVGGVPQQAGGQMAFVPDAFGIGVHGIYFNSDSGAGDDGIAEMFALSVDVSTAGSETASLAWSSDGGKVARSHVIHMAALDRVCTHTWTDYGADLYCWDLDGGNLATLNNGPNSGHGFYDLGAVDFNGTDIIAGGFDGRFIRYGDIPTTAGGFDSCEYYETVPWYGEPRVFGGLYQDENGDSVLVTGTNSRCDDLGNAAQVIALNVSTATNACTALDDSPVLIDNFEIIGSNGTPATLIDVGSFDSYALGDIPLGTNNPGGTGTIEWIQNNAGCSGVGLPQIIADPTGDDRGNVLQLDATGSCGGWQGIYAEAASPLNASSMIIRWDQSRNDNTDNLWYSDNPDFARFWTLQWDSAGDGAARIRQFDGGGGFISTNGAWDTIEYAIDNTANTVTLTINGNVIGSQPIEPANNEGELRGWNFELSGTPIDDDEVESTPTVFAYDTGVCQDHGFTVRGGPLLGPASASLGTPQHIYYFDAVTGELVALKPAAGFVYPECDPPSTAACPNMDVNCDNQVNGFDIADVRNTANWNIAPESAANARADTNRDGAINGFDIADIRNTACWNQ